MQVHVFGDSREAYDASQSDDDIHDGDILLVPSEDVAGILYQAWPVAVTPGLGAFHGPARGQDTCTIQDWLTRHPGYADAAALALDIAARHAGAARLAAGNDPALAALIAADERVWSGQGIDDDLGIDEWSSLHKPYNHP